MPEPPVEPQSPSWVDKLQAFFEVVLMSGLFSSFVATVPFTLQKHRTADLLQSVHVVTGFVLLEAAITFAILALILAAHGETLADLGLRWDLWRSQLILGLILVPLLFLLNGLVGGVFRVFLPKFFTERNPLMDIIHTRRDLGMFMASVLIAGGVKEELQRAFILMRFRDHLGGAKLGLTGSGEPQACASLLRAAGGLLPLRGGSREIPEDAAGGETSRSLSGRARPWGHAPR